jgi:hypothetical protein
LDKLGLDRVPQKVTDLDAYVREKYGSATSPSLDNPAALDSASTRAGE